MRNPLTPDRWRRVNDLFLEAVDLPPAERAAWLDAQCDGDEELRREVESLLGSDAPADTDTSFVRAVDVAVADAAAAVSGVVAAQMVGPYRILREIGQGGMGTVFLAVRDDDEFRQRVAIKVVRGVPGADTERRFRAERQILASLEHPSIARLLDGGTTRDGMPYLVMEYVDGVPIDEYCRQQALPIRERLLLFCRVCDAVTHAHRSLVVHRDIKPSNILVTADGTPKLLDFGVAKLLDDPAERPVTITGMRALTPEYASPEQVRGQAITTAADVYSLGVLLFELLTGQRPLKFRTQQPAEIERVVCEVEPGKPSTVVENSREARRLAGDLDTIVLAALRKDPALRYPTAARLADDIRLHLDGHPVLARPATLFYRSSRFVRRHRAGVAAAVVFVILVVGFAVATAFQARRVAQERDTAEEVTNLLLELYSSYDPSQARGSAVTAQELLDRGAARIQAELGGQPQVQAQMLDAIGSLYMNNGIFDRAVDVLKDSLAIRQASGADDGLDTANTQIHLARALVETARFAEAEPLAAAALEIRKRLAGPRTAETAEALDTLGLVRYLRGGLDGEPLVAEAVDIWRATKGPASGEFASGLRTLARHWRERADYLQADRFERADLLKAERFERELLVVRRKTFGDVHALTASSLNAVGQLQRAMGRPAEAEHMFREALAVRRRLFGTDAHSAVLEPMHNLALALHDQGRRADAEPLYRAAVAAMQAVLAGGRIDRSAPGVNAHPQLAININNLGTLLEDERRFDEAEAAYREAIAMRRQLLGHDHPGVARMLNSLARVMSVRGRPADALPIADEALAIRRAKLGDAHFETLASMVMRGSILGALGRRAEAEPLLQAGLAGYRRLLPPGNRHLAAAGAAVEKLKSGESGK